MTTIDRRSFLTRAGTVAGGLALMGGPLQVLTARLAVAAPSRGKAAVLDYGPFCVLATSSAENRPHAAGVLYALVDRDLYVNTDLASRKARNIAENDRVALCVPVQAAGDAPPFTASLQAARVLANAAIDTRSASVGWVSRAASATPRSTR